MSNNLVEKVARLRSESLRKASNHSSARPAPQHLVAIARHGTRPSSGSRRSRSRSEEPAERRPKRLFVENSSGSPQNFQSARGVDAVRLLEDARRRDSIAARDRAHHRNEEALRAIRDIAARAAAKATKLEAAASPKGAVAKASPQSKATPRGNPRKSK